LCRLKPSPLLCVYPFKCFLRALLFPAGIAEDVYLIHLFGQKKIKPMDRKISLEEAIEWMIVLEESCFSDLGAYNFIVAHDGIYCIDTSVSNFSKNPLFGSIENQIIRYLREEDKSAFLELLQKRKQNYQDYVMKEKKQKISTFYDYFYNTYQRPYNYIARAVFTDMKYKFIASLDGIKNNDPDQIQIKQDK